MIFWFLSMNIKNNKGYYLISKFIRKQFLLLIAFIQIILFLCIQIRYNGGPSVSIFTGLIHNVPTTLNIKDFIITDEKVLFNLNSIFIHIVSLISVYFLMIL